MYVWDIVYEDFIIRSDGISTKGPRMLFKLSAEVVLRCCRSNVTVSATATKQLADPAKIGQKRGETASLSPYCRQDVS